MNYLQTVAVGRITADAKFFASSGDKKALAAFTVAVNRGDDAVTYVECELRGDRAEKLQKYLVKGKEVLCTGTPGATAFMSNNEARASLKLYTYDVQLGSDSQGQGSKGDDPV